MNFALDKKIMDKVRITRIFRFEAAHALNEYNGPCKNIHGHSYKLWVTVCGTVDHLTGMLIDFSSLKAIVNESIIKIFDHSLMLHEEDELIKNKIEGIAKNVIALPFNPTSENLVISFSDLICHALPIHVQLHHLKVFETEFSFSEWYAEDNK
jgi:6-pyruvoyltetrahydropterin/6-carboxytetrahydropterin synthase